MTEPLNSVTAVTGVLLALKSVFSGKTVMGDTEMLAFIEGAIMEMDELRLHFLPLRVGEVRGVRDGLRVVGLGDGRTASLFPLDTEEDIARIVRERNASVTPLHYLPENCPHNEKRGNVHDGWRCGGCGVGIDQWGNPAEVMA